MTAFEIVMSSLIFGSGALGLLAFFLLGTRFRYPRFCAACFLVMGFGLLVGLIRSNYWPAMFGAETEGVVTEIVPVRKGSRPVVAFRTAEGTAIETKCKVGNSRERFNLGQTVTVIYLESEPTWAQVGGRSSFLLPILLGTPLCFLPILAAVYLLVVRKSPPQKEPDDLAFLRDRWE